MALKERNDFSNRDTSYRKGEKPYIAPANSDL